MTVLHWPKLFEGRIAFIENGWGGGDGYGDGYGYGDGGGYGHGSDWEDGNGTPH